MGVGTRFVLAVMAAGILSGCADSSRIVHADRIASTDREAAISAAGGVQPVIVVGAPPDGAGPEAVIAALRAPAPWAGTRFVPAEAGEQGMRLVLEFGKRRSDADSCRSPSAGGQSTGLVVAASLCRRTGAVSSATLLAPGVAGPSDPAFAARMRETLRVLYTPERPMQRFGFLR